MVNHVLKNQLQGILYFDDFSYFLSIAYKNPRLIMYYDVWYGTIPRLSQRVRNTADVDITERP